MEAFKAKNVLFEDVCVLCCRNGPWAFVVASCNPV